MRIGWFCAVSALVLGGLGCSDKPPEAPAQPAPTEEPAPADTGFGGDTVATSTVAMPGPPKMTGDVGAGQSQPDDYIAAEVDCVELGKAYGAVTRSDLEAQLSPKLSAKQRAGTQKSIDAAGDKMQAQAENTCRKSMLGNVVDRAALKCAIDAKTAKAFDACLNGAAPPKKTK
jgi:hypothetical protein